MKKHILTTMVGAGLLLASGTAFAYVSDDAREALENRDYNAYIEAVEGTKKADITEARFEQKADRYEIKQEQRSALEANDYNAFLVASEGSRADNVSEERFGELVERFKLRQERKASVENQDYTSFASTFTGERATPSQETFELIVDLQSARVNGDQDAVQEIRNELKESGDWRGKRGKGGLRGDRSKR